MRALTPELNKTGWPQQASDSFARRCAAVTDFVLDQIFDQICDQMLD
jgi:hypothetical protein